MRYLLILILVFLAACGRAPSYQNIPEQNDLRTIEFPLFKIKVTGGWEKYELSDSTGYIIRDNDSISYKLGSNIASPVSLNDTNLLYMTESINGIQADISIPAKTIGGYTALYYLRNKKLLLRAKIEKKEDDLLRIFSTVQFPGESTMKIVSDLHRAHFNGPYSEDEGRRVFAANCASCHRPDRDLAGPALKRPEIRGRSIEWIYRFLTDERFKPNDRTERDLKQLFNGSCRKFPKLSRQQITAIFNDHGSGCIRYDLR